MGERISMLIRGKQITQADLAETIGVSQAAVSGWCNGAMPKADQLFEMARYFNCPPEYILEGKALLPVPNASTEKCASVETSTLPGRALENARREVKRLKKKLAAIRKITDP
jgi:transcriptional regulator with XRE-family HTH domain